MQAILKKNSTVLVLVLAIALLLAAVAVYELLEAQRAAVTARVDDLVIQSVSVRDTEFDLSLLLSVEAFHLADTPRTRAAILDIVQANPQLIQYLRSDISASAVTFSPDGRSLAIGRADGAIVVWDIATRKPSRTLVARWTPAPDLPPTPGAHTLGPVSTLIFSPDGKVLISGIQTLIGDHQIISMWDLVSGQPIAEPLLEERFPRDLILSPDGKTLAISEQGDVSFWDMQREQFVGQFPLQLFEGAPVGLFAYPVVYSPVFSPDGKTFAAISSVNTITFWEVATLQPIGEPLMVGEMYVNNGVNRIAFARDGKTLLAAYPDGTLTAWNLSTHQRQALWQPLQSRASWVLFGYATIFSPGANLAASSDRGLVHVVDTQTGREIIAPLEGNSNRFGGMAFNSDGSRLASIGDHGVILWDLSNGRFFGQIIAEHIQALGSGPTGNVLAVGWSNAGMGCLAFWDSKTQQFGEQLNPGIFPIASVFSPDGKKFAAADNNGRVMDWDVETRKLLGQLDFGANAYVSSLIFSPDGGRLAVGVLDPKVGVVLWDGTSSRVSSQVLHTAPFGERSLAFSPDGKILAVGGSDGSLVLWNVEAGSSITLKTMSDTVDSVAFSPDGKELASTSRDGQILLWDVRSRGLLGRPFMLPSAGIPDAVAFSPDGKMLVSGNYDDTINIWDVATRETIGQGLVGNGWPVDQVAFSPDGHMLATVSDRGILWDMNPQSWADKICQRAGRNLTRGEWARYFPAEAYRITCPQWPAETESAPMPTNTP